jgi:CRISPR/Cas system-associated protein Cas10 (large subunit of type III CRISPR-Cas system)
MVAASELFTEHYLRRHFSWYNSELWLEDILHHTNVLVALSEHDEIINATKVKQQLDICNSERGHKNQFQVIYWEHVGHAVCVTSRSKWIEIKQQMLKQELALVQAQ